VIVGQKEEISILELYLDYPNHCIFSLTNSTIDSFMMKGRLESWAISAFDNNILFTTSHFLSRSRWWTSFQIWNISNKSSPKQIGSSFDIDGKTLGMKFTSDYRQVYLYIEDDTTPLMNIIDLSNLIRPKEIAKQLLNMNTIDFVLFSDGRSAYSLTKNFDIVDLMFLDYSDVANPNELLTHFPLRVNALMLVTKDEKTLFVASEQLVIFDISDLKSPQKIFYSSYIEGDSGTIYSVALSGDEKILFMDFIGKNFRRLHIYNVTNKSSPKLLSKLSLPGVQIINSPKLKTNFNNTLVISADMKTAYIAQEGSLLFIDISDLQKPSLIGTTPVLKDSDFQLTRFALLKDEKTAYVSKTLYSESSGNPASTVISMINLAGKYSLYLKQEKFLMGEKYSDTLMMLKYNNENSEYESMAVSDYRFIQSNLFEVRASSAIKSENWINRYKLPNWVQFNKDESLLFFTSW